MTVEMFNLIEEEGEGKKYEEKEVSGGGLSGQIGAGFRSPKTEGLRHATTNQNRLGAAGLYTF